MYGDRNWITARVERRHTTVGSACKATATTSCTATVSTVSTATVSAVCKVTVKVNP